MSALHAHRSAGTFPSLALRCIAVVPLVFDVTAGRPVATPEFEYVLLVLLHPPVLRRTLGVRVTLPHVAWITTGVLLHEFGMVYGLYSITWWDHLTHAVSGSLVAAAGYTAVRAYARRYGGVSPRAVAAATGSIVLASSAAWEVYERFTPDLMTYGVLDTTADLAFALLGTALVLRYGDRLLRGPIRDLAARLPDRPTPGRRTEANTPSAGDDGHAPGD